MRLLHFILSHSLFIALCAAALCWQTDLLLHTSCDLSVYAFVFFATLCGYNFYWLLSKFYFSGRKITPGFFSKHKSFFILCLLAAAGAIFFFMKEKVLLPFIAVAAVLTALYSLPLWPFPFAKKLQKAGFLKPLVLAFTWAFVTVAFPAADLSNPFTRPVIILFAARFFFMLLLCVIFDMRDVIVDKMHGLHSLATDVSRQKLNFIIGFIFLFYYAAGILSRVFSHDVWQLPAFAVTGMLVWVVYRLSLKKRGYVFYYFLVDGLMLISALLTFLADLI